MKLHELIDKAEEVLRKKTKHNLQVRFIIGRICVQMMREMRKSGMKKTNVDGDQRSVTIRDAIRLLSKKLKERKFERSESWYYTCARSVEILNHTEQQILLDACFPSKYLHKIIEDKFDTANFITRVQEGKDKHPFRRFFYKPLDGPQKPKEEQKDRNPAEHAGRLRIVVTGAEDEEQIVNILVSVLNEAKRLGMPYNTIAMSAIDRVSRL